MIRIGSSRIKIMLQKPKSIDENIINFTSSLAKILSNRIPYNLIDNYINLIETAYADEISAFKSNIIKGEKNEYGCDLHEKV